MYGVSRQAACRTVVHYAVVVVGMCIDAVACCDVARIKVAEINAAALLLAAFGLEPPHD